MLCPRGAAVHRKERTVDPFGQFLSTVPLKIRFNHLLRGRKNHGWSTRSWEIGD